MFSHPGDFTPVCTTEFMAFAMYFPFFAQRNVQLLGLSIDSLHSHLAWVYNIYRTTGIEIPFPVIADRGSFFHQLFRKVSGSFPQEYHDAIPTGKQMKIV